jgi:hypothetical protein
MISGWVCVSASAVVFAIRELKISLTAAEKTQEPVHHSLTPVNSLTVNISRWLSSILRLGPVKRGIPQPVLDTPCWPVVVASLESQSSGWRLSALVGSTLATLLETNMKAILLAALALGYCGVAVAEGDDKVDSIGTWKCEYKIGDQQRTSELTIKKDGDNLVGTMNWPDQKDVKLKDVKLKDGELTFSAERKVMDNTFTVEYKFKVDGDKIKGKGSVDAGGEKREFDIEGTREKKDK